MEDKGQEGMSPRSFRTKDVPNLWRFEERRRGDRLGDRGGMDGGECDEVLEDG